jgi:phage shock protein E
MIKKLVLGVLFSLGFSVSAMGETFLIDVRTPEEFAIEHISGALNVEYQNVASWAEKNNVKTDDDIYVYCRSGKRAETAKLSLNEKGYTKVTNLGGIEDVKASLGR